jgi:hypothetical protein
MKMIKLPPISKKKIHKGCMICSCVEQVAPMDLWITVGFGSAFVTKDGEVTYSEPPNTEWEDTLGLVAVELTAREYPESDWRVHLSGPLHGEVYQRQGKNKWVLVESNRGFA